jgi:protein gp37
MSTKIEWTDATWNPVTGCTKISQGCKNCYAERLAPKVFAGQTILSEAPSRESRPRLFTDVLCHPSRLDAPLHWKKPRRIFVNSMSDLFHEDVPDDFIFDVFSIMARAHWHTFQVLTKRPERMWQLIGEPVEAGEEEPPRNIWWGVSVEDQATADERIPLLLQTPAAVRFLSCEPLLGPIDIQAAMNSTLPAHGNLAPGPAVFTVHGRPIKRDLHWVIAGGESGPKARPSHPEWFRSLRDQCAAAGVPFFFKQWGEWGPTGNPPILMNEPGAVQLQRLGKKAAGRLLDGREHMEYPA